MIMGQLMTHNMNNYINNYLIHKSDHLSINPLTYLMTTIVSKLFPPSISHTHASLQM